MGAVQFAGQLGQQPLGLQRGFGVIGLAYPLLRDGLQSLGQLVRWGLDTGRWLTADAMTNLEEVRDVRGY